MENEVMNCNGKIVFFSGMKILKVSSVKRMNNISDAICKDHLRRHLWDKLLQHDNGNDKPWCTFGDFNVITARDEKI